MDGQTHKLNALLERVGGVVRGSRERRLQILQQTIKDTPLGQRRSLAAKQESGGGKAVQVSDKRSHMTESSTKSRMHDARTHARAHMHARTHTVPEIRGRRTRPCGRRRKALARLPPPQRTLSLRGPATEYHPAVGHARLRAGHCARSWACRIMAWCGAAMLYRAAGLQPC
jgi:hypothetical protein